MVEILFALMIGFTMKHFIADYPLQAFPYMYRNKGTYGHPGGILHASVHGVSTLMTLVAVAIVTGLPMCLPLVGLMFKLSAMDAVIHYHIDWAKMSLNACMGWGPTTHEEFWVLLGADQLLHALTYILLAYLFLNGVAP